MGWRCGGCLHNESLDSSLHIMVFAPCGGCCGDFVANVHALKANLFVLDKSAGLFRGGLVSGNCVSGIPRNSWAVCPSLPGWSIVIGMRAQFFS